MKKHLLLPMAMLGMAFLAPPANADLLVYEPFNYAPVNNEVDGRLAGKNGGLGWGGAWVDSADAGYAFIYDSQGNPVDLYGGTFGGGDPNWDGVINNLPGIGNYVGLSDWSSEAIGQSRLNAYRRLGQSAGAMAAENGGVLWLSMGAHFVNNGFFVTPTVMLTTQDSYLQERGRTLSGSGAGLGTALGNDFNNSTLTKDLNPLFMAAGVQTVKTTGVDMPVGDLTVILKFEFGPESDTVRVWYFGESATMDEATFNANAIAATSSIDESTLNTLTYAFDRKANAIDEIRIGKTFTSVITLPPPGAVNADISTVAATPAAAPADGSTTSTITVTLRDSIGVPVAGKDVTLAGNPGNAVITPLTAVTTDSNGQATFTVSSNVPGTEVFTATNTTDSLVITQTASVTFVSSADADQSTVVASPLFVDANGTSTSTVTVTLKSAEAVPVAGKTVSLAGNPGTAVITPGSRTSNVNGVATFTVSSTTSGTVVFTATDTTDSIVVTQTASVNFVGSASAGLSTVAASPNTVVANGTTTSTITVSVKDANGFPAAGRNVTLANTAGPQAAVINPLTAVATNANGVGTFTVSSSTLGTEVFTATVTTDSVIITQTASVEFVDPATPFAFNVNFEQFTPSLGTPVDPSTLVGPTGGLGTSWNQFAAVSSIGTLIDPTGVKTGIAFTTNFSESRDGGAENTPMLRSTLTDFARGQQRTFTITGLPPGSVHDIWLASYREQPSAIERTFGRWTANNPTVSASIQYIDNRDGQNGTTFVEGYNYIVFRSVVADGTGQISFTGKGMTVTDGFDADYRLGLSGFQVVPVGPALITSFGVPGAEGVIDQSAKTISLTVPSGTNLATLAPTFTLSSGTCNQTSGAPPSPTFAVQNPATYTVTDNSTDPVTINNYTVTVTVDITTTTLVIDLGTSPAGTVIEGGTFIGTGPTNLPLPALPPGSILRSIAVNTTLVTTDNQNLANDLTVLLDPTPETAGGDFSLGITGPSPTQDFGPPAATLTWVGGAGAEGTPLVDTKTAVDWAAVAPIDLATTGLFLGNAYGGPTVGGTWSGTITLTYDLVGAGSPFENWAGGEPFAGDANGDGVSNGLAFLLGAANPDANALGLLPTISEDAGGLVLSFSMLNTASRGASMLSVEHSSDLGIGDPWTAVLVPESSGSVGGVSFTVTPGTPLNSVTATISNTEASGGKLFGRLSAEEN